MTFRCRVFQQVDSMSAMVMVDQDGKRLEVIVLDRGHGPQQYIRVSWHRRFLLGRGYYRRHEMADALALLDVGSRVEGSPFRPRRLAAQSFAAPRSAIWAVIRWSTVPY